MLAKLIVGIDPGRSTGIAAIEMESGKAMLETIGSERDIVTAIAGMGEPVIFGSLLRKPPPLGGGKDMGGFRDAEDLGNRTL